MSNEELVDRIQHGINKTEYLGQLYIQNKGFIFNVVKKYRYVCQGGYNGLPIIERDELIHEAYFGLVEAAKRYNPLRAVLFLPMQSIGSDRQKNTS
jgi:RNA polymerase primary sigma factor